MTTGKNLYSNLFLILSFPRETTCDALTQTGWKFFLVIFLQLTPNSHKTSAQKVAVTSPKQIWSPEQKLEIGCHPPPPQKKSNGTLGF